MERVAYARATAQLVPTSILTHIEGLAPIKQPGHTVGSVLLSLFRPYWLRVFEAAAATFLSTALVLPMPLLSAYIIDQVIANGELMVLHAVCALIAFTLLLGAGLSLLQRYLLLIFTRRVFFDLEMHLFKVVNSLPVPFFREYGTGYISTRISDDVRQLGSLMAGTYIGGLSSLALLLTALVIMINVHATLALATFAVLPGFVWVNLRFGRIVQALGEAAQERKGLTSAGRIESLDAMWTVRAFDREKRESGKLARNLHKELDVTLARDASMMGAQILQMGLYAVGALCLLWYGAYEIIAKRLTLGQFVAFNSLVAYVYGPMTQISGMFVAFRQGLGVLTRVVELLNMPREPSGSARVGHSTKGRVLFSNVRFAYTPVVPVLNGVSFQVEPDSVVAITGPTGGGKTTLLNLLLRFYDPDMGVITVDGNDVRAMDVRELRSRIGFVPQEVRMFSGSIRDNIAYGKPGASLSDVEAAAEEMNCTEFIENFPEGLHTRIGQGGVQLSGGQKQRVALARAIIREPAILILDEAIASLDARSGLQVHGALRRACDGRTTVLVSHNLPTISMADKVVVVAQGLVTEQGSLEELLARDSYLSSVREGLENENSSSS